MTVTEGSLSIVFAGALDAFKFDEENRASPHFHGLSHCMKAVDFIVEYSDFYLFVEIKNPPAENRYREREDRQQLIKSLVGKYRDSFLYRFAEQKVDKPVRYVCLIEEDNVTLNILQNDLKRQLPLMGPGVRWKTPIAQMCAVVNTKHWNRNFPNWKITTTSARGT